MKPEELDEGVADWVGQKMAAAGSSWSPVGAIARTGILGQSAKNIAASQKASGVERKSFVNDFVMKMANEFRQKLQYFSEDSFSGNYENFNTLVESIIVEAPLVSMSDWVNEYIDSKIKLYKLSPSDVAIKNKLIQDFINAAGASTPPKFPQNIAMSLGEWLYDLAIRQSRDARTGQVVGGDDASASTGAATPLGSDSPPDKGAFDAAVAAGKTTIGGVTYNVPTLSAKNRTFVYDFQKQKWMDATTATNPLPLTDANSITLLNRLYHRTYKI